MILNLSGGSNNSLNFKVVGGTTRPTNPKENTIWVNTSVEITGYAFSEEEPTSKSSGLVWFCLDYNSRASFNTIKKDIIMVYPASVKQYSSSGLGGSWTEREAEIYMNGKWVVLGVETLWIFKSGTGLGKGFTGFTTATGESVNITCTTTNVDTNDFYVRSSERTRIGLNEAVDITNYKTLHISGVTCHFNSNGNANETWFGICVYSASGQLLGEVGIASTTESGGYIASNKSTNLDASKITGKVYIAIDFTTSAAYPVTIDEFYFTNLWID